jgi:hypothetical protein
MVVLICAVLLTGVLLELCFHVDHSIQRAGCLLVAIAVFFAFGEVINFRIINSTLPAVQAHYEGSPENKEHLNDLEAEGAELNDANLIISGWQFFMAILGTLVWGFG